MITTDDRWKYAIVSFIQDALAGALAGKVSLANIHARDGTTLAHELRNNQALPRNLILDFSPLLDVLRLPILGKNPTIDAVLAILTDPLDELRGILNNDDPGVVLGRLKNFFSKGDEFASLSMMLGSFLEGQFGIALSLVTTFKNLVDPRFPRAVLDGCLAYFFGKEGYVTVDDIHLSPPMQFSGQPMQLGDLKSFLAEKTAERYVRDLISVIVEATGDVQYELRDRYPHLSILFTAPAERDTAQRWFTGFAAMAEAGVTSAVEETLLGIGQFQGNRLIAAAAGAYAGTAARKATQHVFLHELGI